MSQHSLQSHFIKGPRHFLAAAVVFLYIIVIFNLFSVMGLRVAIFTVLPIMVIPLLYGLKIGVFSFSFFTFLGTPLLLWGRSGEFLYDRYINQSSSIIVLTLLISLLVGYIHDLKQKIVLLDGQIGSLARFDSLTKLLNRRSFYDHLESEFIRTNRKIWEFTHSGQTRIPDTFDGIYSVALLDLDNFKSINETFGHLVADKVLVEVAKILVAKGVGFRESDVVGRYGGEEFIILMPDTFGRNAKVPLERIRRKLKSVVFVSERGEQFSVSFSCGIAQIKSNDQHSNEIINRADKALYYAKNNGKDQTYFYDELMKAGISLTNSLNR